MGHTRVECTGGCEQLAVRHKEDMTVSMSASSGFAQPNQFTVESSADEQDLNSKFQLFTIFILFAGMKNYKALCSHLKNEDRISHLLP